MHNECHKEYHAFTIVLTLITKVTLVLQPSKSGVSGSSNRGSCWAEVSELKMMLNGAPAIVNGVAKISHAVVSFAAPPGQVLERADRAAVEGL